MCLLLTVLLLGPRTGVVLWWVVSPERWDATFDSFWLPFLGFLLAPWLTLAYVWVTPGGYSSFDWFTLVVAGLADVASAGGGYRTRA